MEYNLKGLKPNSLQQKAQEQLMEYPNATWNNISTHNNQEDLLLQISSNFLHIVQQIKAELTTLSQEMRNLGVEFEEHLINTMDGNSRPLALNQKKTKKLSGSLATVRKRKHSKVMSQKNSRRRNTKSTI